MKTGYMAHKDITVNGTVLLYREAVVFYCIGVLNEAKQRGWIGGGPSITPKGIAAFNSLIRSGFKPTAEEISKCVAAFAGDKSQAEMTTTLVVEAIRLYDEWADTVEEQ